MSVPSSLTNPAEMRNEGRLVRVCIMPMLGRLIFVLCVAASWAACSRSAAPYANEAVPAGLYLPACSRW
jgi:hypothetical protein